MCLIIWNSQQSNFSTAPAKEIIDFTGTAKMTVYDCISRIKETGSPKPRTGRPLTATSKENVIKARKIISKNPEVSNRACKEIEKLQAVEVSFETSLGVHYGWRIEKDCRGLSKTSSSMHPSKRRQLWTSFEMSKTVFSWKYSTKTPRKGNSQKMQLKKAKILWVHFARTFFSTLYLW